MIFAAIANLNNFGIAYVQLNKSYFKIISSLRLSSRFYKIITDAVSKYGNKVVNI
jgi:hypothetical protein